LSLASIKHIDCPKGSEELECSECRASLEFSYETAVEIKEVIFIDLPKTKLKKPYDELSREVLERKDASATKKNCPVCRKVVPVAVIEFADLPKGNDIVNCPTCNADLEVYYKASFQVTEIEVTGVAGDGNFACPECETEMELDWQEIETNMNVMNAVPSWKYRGRTGAQNWAQNWQVKGLAQLGAPAISALETPEAET